MCRSLEYPCITSIEAPRTSRVSGWIGHILRVRGMRWDYSSCSYASCLLIQKMSVNRERSETSCHSLVYHSSSLDLGCVTSCISSISSFIQFLWQFSISRDPSLDKILSVLISAYAHISDSFSRLTQSLFSTLALQPEWFKWCFFIHFIFLTFHLLLPDCRYK